MKNILALLSGILLFSGAFASVKFSIDYAIFQANNEPYLEFYLTVTGNSIGYGQIEKDGEQELFKGQVEMTYLIEDGDKVIAFEKFQLNSPAYNENEVANQTVDLIDLKRLKFPIGIYSYTVIAKDLVNGSTAEASGTLRNYSSTIDNLQFSEIQLGNSISPTKKKNQFSKVGFDIVPNVDHNYIRNNNKLSAYFEIYNASAQLGDSTAYLLDIKVIDAISGKPTANLRATKRLKSNKATSHIQPFNIDKLPTGRYEVLIEARNRNNEVIATQRVGFFRLNPELQNLDNLGIEGTFVDSMRNPELLAEYIRSIRVISKEREKIWGNNQLKYAELEFMQRYFLNFWRNRDELNPELAWENYKEKLILVDEEFGYGGVSGYRTDRGRVYLQYGKPQQLQDVPYDSDNHPYTIWQYYKLTDCYRNELNGLTDRKFIFYSNTNEMLGYEVLHSNVPGEVQNEQWEFTLNKKQIGKRPGTRENTTLEGQDRARDLFNNPR
jgi:GWxTD domain-containing protein